MSFTKTRVSDVLESKRTPREITIGPAARAMRGRKQASLGSIRLRDEAVRRRECQRLAADLGNIQRDINDLFRIAERIRNQMVALSQAAAASTRSSTDRAIVKALSGIISLVPHVRAAKSLRTLIKFARDLMEDLFELLGAAEEVGQANITQQRAARDFKQLFDHLEHVNDRINNLRNQAVATERFRQSSGCEPIRRQF